MRAPSRVLRAFACLILVALGASACGGALDPITAANVQGCVKKNCSESDAATYKSCEASCHQRYGK